MTDINERLTQLNERAAYLQGKQDAEYEKLSAMLEKACRNPACPSDKVNGSDYCENHLKPFIAHYEAGNFKRQYYSRTENFATLAEARSFIENGIGSLQGTGYVLSGGERVWEYEDEAERAYWEQVMHAEEK